MGMPRGLAKATNYYNNIEARRDFYRLAHEVVSAGHSEIVRKHIPPENAGWRKVDKHKAALLAEWNAFQQNAHPTLGESAASQSVFNTETLSTSDGVPPSAPARVA